MARPSAPERIALGALAVQSWKNGAGLTREIAVSRGDIGPIGFDWRISLAEVERDAPFSAYPGIDRCITLLRGAGMRLQSADGALDHALDTHLRPFHFSGDLSLQASLRDGACQDFNVMTRRGVWRADVGAVHDAGELQDADATLLLAVEGSWTIAAGTTDHDAAWDLPADHALLWRSPRGALRATPSSPHRAALLVVRLCQHRS